MKFTSHTSGLSIPATIIIIAVLGISGYTIYNAKVRNNNQVNIQDAQQTEQRRNELKVMVDIKSDILTSLARLGTEISLHSRGGIEEGHELIHRLRLRSLEASGELSGGPKVELERFAQQLLSLEEILSTEDEVDYAKIDTSLESSLAASDVLFSSQNAQAGLDAEILEQQHDPDDNKNYVTPEGGAEVNSLIDLSLER